ncbi:unnamed protein product, partial [Lymnaea stagnalis]
QDSVNIPLLGLAVSDLCCDVTMSWCVICQGITRFGPVTFPVEPFGLMIMTASYPRVIFSRITSWLTALISLERCACVAFPLKVKSIFTPRNTGVMTFTIFAVLLASNMLIYYPREFQMKSNPNLNLTRLTMVILTDRLNSAAAINAILFISLPFINVILIIGCAVVLIIKLERSQKWRQHAQSGDQPIKRSPQKLIRLRPKTTPEHRNGKKLKKSIHSAKELKLTKMITSLTMIFLVCNMPSNGLLAASIFVPGFTSTGKFAELFQMLHSVAFFLETVNSSVNLLVYYAMSSKFKAEFMKLLTGPWRNFKMVETSNYPIPSKIKP